MYSSILKLSIQLLIYSIYSFFYSFWGSLSTHIYSIFTKLLLWVLKILPKSDVQDEVLTKEQEVRMKELREQVEKMMELQEKISNLE